MITHMLRTKTSSKATQLSGHSFPRILVITCEHIASDVLLGSHGAETLLTSDTKIEVPIDKPIENIDLVTDLKDSVFFRFKNGLLESCRKSISAILLLSILYLLTSYLLELRSQREKTISAIALAKEAQLQMLRYQLNPHFLFNALNSIRTLVYEDTEKADRIITSLSDFLRYSLSYQDNREVTLEEEIEVIKEIAYRLYSGWRQ